MGDFSATCPISRLAIREGEEVFWMYSTKKHINSTYDLSQELGFYLRSSVEFEKLSKLLTDSKHLEAIKPDKTIFWGFGKYNGYGSIDDIDISDELFDKLILIRKNIADEMVDFGKGKIEREWNRANPELINAYKNCYPYCLILVASLTRCNLYGFQLLGRQYPDTEEMKEITHIQKIIKRETAKVYLELVRRELEYANWSWRVGLKYKITNLISKFLNKGEK